MSIELDPAERVGADTEEKPVSSNKATRLALKRLASGMENILAELLPLEIYQNKNGQAVSVPQLLTAVVEGKTFKQAARELSIPESSVRQMTKAWLLFLQQQEKLPNTPTITIDEHWEKWLSLRIAEYHNYQEMAAFVGTAAFRDEADILAAIRVSKSERAASEGKYSILDLLLYVNGWGVDKHSTRDLSAKVGRSEKHLAALTNAAMLLLNEVYGLELVVETSVEADRFLEGMLIQYDRMLLTHQYLTEHEASVLPVERRVLELYLQGHTQEEIIADLHQMQQASSEDMLVATPYSTARFLQSVHQLTSGVNPFARVALAARAEQLLRTEQIRDPFYLEVLQGIKSGLSFAAIARNQSVAVRDVRAVASQFDLKMPSGQQNRVAVLRDRRQLLQQAHTLADWEGKEEQLAVLQALISIPEQRAQTEGMPTKNINELIAEALVPTYAEVAAALGITEDQVSFSMARLRAMVKRKGRPINRSRQFG